MPLDETKLRCPKCGSKMIQREHPNGSEPGVIYYCMCCHDDDYEDYRHFMSKRTPPEHRHSKNCWFKRSPFLRQVD